MKKFNLFLIVSFFTFLSCSDNDTQFEETQNLKEKQNEFSYRLTFSEQINNIYNNIIGEKNLTNQLIIANSLSPEEKYAIWQLKLQNFKDFNSLNNNQNEFINKLQTLITEDLFTNEASRISFNNSQIQTLYNESITLFGNDLGHYLLTNVENSNQTLDKIYGNSNYPPSNVSVNQTIEACNCSANSHCTRLTGVSWIGLSWEYGTCNGGSCYRRSIAILSFEIWESSDNKRCTY
jgi:hypothetical protein